MRLTKKFGLFLLFNLVVWSVVPLLRKSLPMDTQEAIVWGKYCLWGTTKHPPLSGWIAYCFYLLSGKTDGAMYLLSQIFVALGVFYIYKLARLFVDETKSVLAAMLQFGVIYYNFSTVEFNVNVVSLALWPMCAYYFWQAYRNNFLRDWLVCGIVAGLIMLDKYVGCFLIAAFGIFVLTDKNGRQVLTNYKDYIAGLCALALLAPHIWWLYENDFVMWEYIAERSQNKKGNFGSRGHLIYPLKFVLAQILYAAAAISSYLFFYRKMEKDERHWSAEQKHFMLAIGFLPLMFFLLSGAVSGAPMKSMWGFPCLFATGLLLFLLLPCKIEAETARRMFMTMAVWSMLFAGVYAAQCLWTRSERFRTDSAQMVRFMENLWAEQGNDKPLEYVGSDAWYANMAALYGSGQIKPMIWMKPKKNPWLDAVDFAQKGALVITSSFEEYEEYRQYHEGKITAAQRREIIFSNVFGKTKAREVFYGFYNAAREEQNGQ